MEEVEIGGDEEEYEVVPLGPVRKLEKRLEELEKEQELGKGEQLLNNVVEVVQSNQQIVNQLVQSNVELRNTVEELGGRVEDLLDKMDEFLELLETASEVTIEEELSHKVGEDVMSPVVKEMSDRMEEMTENITSTNEQILSYLEDLDKRVRESSAKEKMRKPRLRVKRSGAASLLEKEEEEGE